MIFNGFMGFSAFSSRTQSNFVRQQKLPVGAMHKPHRSNGGMMLRIHVDTGSKMYF